MRWPYNKESHGVKSGKGGGQRMSPNCEIKRFRKQSFNNAIVSLAVCAVAPFCWNHVWRTFCLLGSGKRNCLVFEQYLLPVTVTVALSFSKKVGSINMWSWLSAPHGNMKRMQWPFLDFAWVFNIPTSGIVSVYMTN